MNGPLVVVQAPDSFAFGALPTVARANASFMGREAIVVTTIEEGTGTTTRRSSRTAQLLELMAKGDGLFNAREFAALDAVHHPNMIAHIPGSAQPIYGREAHSAAMKQLVKIFPDIHVHTPYPIQFGSGDWITVVTRATGTFTGEMISPGGKRIPPTGKAFDVEFAQTTKWDGDELIVISAFWDSALQARQLGIA